MQTFICSNCYSVLTPDISNCPGCGEELIFEGEKQNVLDRLVPNCLIYRYAGSDMLEPAVVIKECKANVKVATKLSEYLRPVTVNKSKVYDYNAHEFSAIQALRNERTATIMRYDKLIQSHWQKLRPRQPN